MEKESCKEKTEVLYSFQLNQADHEVFKDPLVFKKFVGQFNQFWEHVKPVWAARYEDDPDDPKSGSSLYLFLGENVYARGDTLGQSVNFFPYESIDSVVDYINSVLDRGIILSMIVSVPDESLRARLSGAIKRAGLVFDEGIVYRQDLDEILLEDLD